MIKFSFEGKEIEAPTSWDEVTVGHFIKPEFLSGNAIELLSVLSGIAPSKIANTTVDLTEYFKKTVGFLEANPSGWQGTYDKKMRLKLLGVKCDVPKNIEMESFGKKIMLGELMAKSQFIYTAIPGAIAIYLGDQIYPNDWYKRIDEIAEAVLELPIHKVYPIVSFFLILSKQYRKNGTSS